MMIVSTEHHHSRVFQVTSLMKLDVCYTSAESQTSIWGALTKSEVSFFLLQEVLTRIDGPWDSTHWRSWEARWVLVTFSGSKDDESLGLFVSSSFFLKMFLKLWPKKRDWPWKRRLRWKLRVNLMLSCIRGSWTVRCSIGDFWMFNNHTT